MQRESGYYWVKINQFVGGEIKAAYVVAKWAGDHWYSINVYGGFEDKDCLEINETRILSPDEQKEKWDKQLEDVQKEIDEVNKGAIIDRSKLNIAFQKPTVNVLKNEADTFKPKLK